jgi:hypothetical protein
VDESAAQDVEKESPAYDLALAAIVRHNARVDSPKTARNGVDGWESERQRALGYVSVALGSREARK